MEHIKSKIGQIRFAAGKRNYLDGVIALISRCEEDVAMSVFEEFVMSCVNFTLYLSKISKINMLKHIYDWSYIFYSTIGDICKLSIKAKNEISCDVEKTKEDFVKKFTLLKYIISKTNDDHKRNIIELFEKLYFRDITITINNEYMKILEEKYVNKISTRRKHSYMIHLFQKNNGQIISMTDIEIEAHLRKLLAENGINDDFLAYL